MKRHSLDVLSLVFGLVFLLVAAGWIVRNTTRVDLPGAGWYVAGALIVAGLFGIASSLRGPRSDSRSRSAQAPGEAPAGSTQEFGAVTEITPEDRTHENRTH